MKILIAVLGLAMLSACNVVMTQTPLFTPADAAGAPTLRPGVWVFFQEPGCAADFKQPFSAWPDCSGGGIVGANEVAGHKQGAAPDVLEHTPVVLAAGDPRIVQAQVTVDAGMQADVQTSGGATGSASASAPQEAHPYGYAAVVPTKFDAQGRITAFTSWPVLCGPPPPKNAKGEEVAMGTLKPLPGIEMKKGDAVCTTHSTTALRNAAKASEAWAEQPAHSYWLRDGDR